MKVNEIRMVSSFNHEGVGSTVKFKLLDGTEELDSWFLGPYEIRSFEYDVESSVGQAWHMGVVPTTAMLP